MRERTQLSRLCIHESVENVIPKEEFVAAFDDISLEAELVGDNQPYSETDAVATYESRDEFLDASWVHCIRAGYDAFDTTAFEDSGVPLTNSTGIHGTTVSEVAVGFMLSFARLLHVYRDAQNDNTWYTPDYERPFTLEDERVCVVGLGTIGEGVARRTDALGMEVDGVRRSDGSLPSVSSLYRPDQLQEAIDEARFVVLTVPHTPSTEGLIGAPELERMRDDAYLINVARGPIVDEEALVDAIRTGQIAGAGLDVFAEEPLPEESPLWDFEDVIISPHKGSATNQYHRDIADLVVKNVQRYESGDSLVNRVA